MKTLSEMTTGHIIIEAIMFLVCLWLTYMLVKSIIELVRFFFEDDKPDTSEMSARVRYEQTAELEKEISNNQNSSKC